MSLTRGNDNLGQAVLSELGGSDNSPVEILLKVI